MAEGDMAASFKSALRKQLDEDASKKVRAPSPVMLSGKIGLSEKFVRGLQRYVEENGSEDPELAQPTEDAEAGRRKSNGGDNRRMSLPVLDSMQTQEPPLTPGRVLPSPRTMIQRVSPISGDVPSTASGGKETPRKRGLPSPRPVVVPPLAAKPQFKSIAVVPLARAEEDMEEAPSNTRSHSDAVDKPKRVTGFTSVISFKPNRRLSMDVNMVQGSNRRESDSLGEPESFRRQSTDKTGNWKYDESKPSYGFSVLPEDLWVTIFLNFSTKDLSRFARVSKEFNTFIHGTECLWQKVTMSEMRKGKGAVGGDINSSVMRMVTRHGSSMKELRLWGCISLVDDSVRMMTSHCTQLHTLDLNGCDKIGQSAVADVIKVNPDLRDLNLSNTSLGDFLLDEVGTHACLTLTSFAMSNCNDVSDEGMESLQACSNLEKFDCGGCYHVTAAAIGKVFRACPSLAEVDVRYLDQVTDEEVIALLNHSKKLRTLDMRSCTITNKSLLHIAEKKPPLQSIVLAQTQVGDEGLVPMIQACAETLTSIDVSACDNVTDGVAKALVQCPKLKSVNLSYCSGVTDAALNALGVESSLAAPSLETLDVNGCSVSNMGVKALSRCEKLVHLGLTGCYEVSRPGLEVLNHLSRLELDSVPLGSPHRCGTPPPMWGSDAGDPMDHLPTPRVTLGPGDLEDD